MQINVLSLLLTIIVGCSTGESRAVRTSNVNAGTGVSINGSTEQTNPGEDQAGELVQGLRSADASNRRRVKSRVVLFAGQSPEARERIIQALIKMAEEIDARSRLSSVANYEAWGAAIELLGELRATEALELLIECISCNDGEGGLSSYRYPALRSIIMIGPQAVPKLREATNSSYPETRKHAALALGEIGGGEAKKVLEDALRMERDPGVIPSIRIALRQHSQTNSH